MRANTLTVSDKKPVSDTVMSLRCSM